jgi:hypothetical protein
MPRFSQQVLNALSNPQAGMLTGQAIANVGDRLAQIPEEIRAERERQRLLEEQALRRQAGQMAVSSIGAGDASGAIRAAEQLAGLGDAESAMGVLGASQDIRAKAEAQAKLDARKNAMATRADALGLPNIAESVRQAPDDDTLNTIAKDLREVEVKRLPSQTPQQRRAMARSVGLSMKEFADAGLATATDDFFNTFISGQSGKAESWMKSDGSIGVYRFVNGKPFDDSQGKFVEPSELGLVQPAPSVQRVIDASDKVKEKLAEAGVNDIIAMKDKAIAAREELDVINRQIERLGDLPTGLAANLEVNLRSVGQFIGLPYDPALVAADTYMMDVANLVRAKIKAFGSGTSITDADREYAQLMVGGDLTKQSESLERILKIYQDSAVTTINLYNEARSGIQNRIGEENMSTFLPIKVPDLVSVGEEPYKGFSIGGQ